MFDFISSLPVAYASWKDLINDQETMQKVVLGLGIVIFLVLMRRLNKILVIFGLVIIFAFYWVFKNPDALEEYAGYEDDYVQIGSKY